MADADRRDAINALVDQFAETLAEAVDAALSNAEDKVAEAAYQDGVNDVLIALRAWRETLGRDEYEQHYIDGVDDAIITVIQSGAVDSDTAAPTAATEEVQQSTADSAVCDDDTDGM